jgi:hypothetical protein
MTLRRVLAGLDSDGKETFLSDARLDELGVSNTVLTSLWRKDGEVQIPPAVPLQDGFGFPAPGASWVLSWTVPPHSVAGEDSTEEPLKAGELPTGGAHATDSIDVNIILEGQLVFQLADGSESVLERGDSIVVNGVLHTWHNRGDETARVLSVLFGAERSKD